MACNTCKRFEVLNVFVLAAMNTGSIRLRAFWPVCINIIGGGGGGGLGGGGCHQHNHQTSGFAVDTFRLIIEYVSTQLVLSLLDSR